MNLLTQLLPKAAQIHQEPKKRGRWVRTPTRADRARQDEALTEEIRKRLAAWDREQAQKQSELLEKSAELPDGIRVVGQEG
jgi:hypothetical protein